MKNHLKKALCLLLCTAFIFSLCACSGKSASADIVSKIFGDTSKISYSTDYKELSDSKKNKTDTWRHGMVSGNGLQGFIESGSPYSDTFIFQNMHFILPNENVRYCPETYQELDTVKQSIVNGEDIVDNASYDDVYRFHPGGQLRINIDGKGNENYIRYTDFQSSQVGVRYENDEGEWNRTSFTSMADGAVITKIASSSTGAKINATLSFDDISTMANFGNSDEVNLKYKKIVSDSGDSIAMVAHYPDYKNSELKNGGYATLTYVIAKGGTKEKVPLEKNTEENQFIGENNGISIKDADEVYLITISDRDAEMGLYDEFDGAENYSLVNDLYSRTKAVADKYASDGGFDYDAALDEHLAIYSPQFDAVEFNLAADDLRSNEELLKEQRGNDSLIPALAQRAYYSGRYAYLCCSGYSTSRLYGMWTGEWDAGWGSKYTMDANVNLQTSSINTGNMESSPIGYAYFILRQLPDWEENAYATHGFKGAIQAPVNTDGDKAVITETCYPYPFRYWNAGTSWMIQPLYETLKCYGNINIPLSDEFDLDSLRSVLSPTEKDLTDSDIKAITDRGYLRLTEDILYPLLVKSANYWDQLMSPEYYTDKDGGIHYEKGKTTLNDGETYCILPSYSPENNPANYPSPSDANCAIDIAACRDNLNMLIDIMNRIDPGADTSKWQQLKDNLPPYLYDETGALKEWATTEFEENNEHRHLSHLYCAWPLFETQGNQQLTDACMQAIQNRESENEASHALVHRSLIAARLKDRDSLTDALTELMNHKIHYDSLMTNHDYDRGSCYCTDFAIGYLGIINESLVFSNTGEIEVLPALPNSGFDKGTITGIKARTQATVSELKWDLAAKTASVKIKSDIDQDIKVSCGLSDDEKTLSFKAGETKTLTFTLK